MTDHTQRLAEIQMTADAVKTQLELDGSAAKELYTQLPGFIDELGATITAKGAEIARLNKNAMWLNSAMDYLQATSLDPNSLEWLKKAIHGAINCLKAAGVEWDDGKAAEPDPLMENRRLKMAIREASKVVADANEPSASQDFLWLAITTLDSILREAALGDDWIPPDECLAWSIVPERFTADPTEHISLHVELNTNNQWEWAVKDDRLPVGHWTIRQGKGRDSDDSMEQARIAYLDYKDAGGIA